MLSDPDIRAAVWQEFAAATFKACTPAWPASVYILSCITTAAAPWSIAPASASASTGAATEQCANASAAGILPSPSMERTEPSLFTTCTAPVAPGFATTESVTIEAGAPFAVWGISGMEAICLSRVDCAAARLQSASMLTKANDAALRLREAPNRKCLKTLGASDSERVPRNWINIEVSCTGLLLDLFSSEARLTCRRS